MKWNDCIFCEICDTKQKLSAVTTFKVIQHILEAAKHEHHLSIRLAGIKDLIAAEGKYHSKC